MISLSRFDFFNIVLKDHVEIASRE